MMLLMKLRKEIDMYTNKELAKALEVLKRECHSHKRCEECPLRITSRCGLELLDLDYLEDDMIKELGERDG